MREILFRGKTEDGYWVEGNLIKNEDASFIAKTEAYSFIDYCMDCNVPFDCDNMHQVIPETVGQYTGFADKNGKKIFEGDILSVYNSKAFLFVVEWNGNQYVLKCTTNGVSDNILNVIESPEDVEVVGNIYDNPEPINDGDENDRA